MVGFNLFYGLLILLDLFHLWNIVIFNYFYCCIGLFNGSSYLFDSLLCRVYFLFAYNFSFHPFTLNRKNNNNKVKKIGIFFSLFGY
jgi:hypothetical protein